jgi:hypothetical protein
MNPHGPIVVECRACGVMKEIGRQVLDRLPSMMSLKELSLHLVRGEEGTHPGGGWSAE